MARLDKEKKATPNNTLRDRTPNTRGELNLFSTRLQYDKKSSVMEGVDFYSS